MVSNDVLCKINRQIENSILTVTFVFRLSNLLINTKSNSPLSRLKIVKKLQSIQNIFICNIAYYIA